MSDSNGGPQDPGRHHAARRDAEQPGRPERRSRLRPARQRRERRRRPDHAGRARHRGRPGRGERPLRRPHHDPLRRPHRGRQRVVLDPAEVGGQPHRAQRCGEDDVLQRADRALRGHRGCGLPGREGHHRGQAAQAGGDGSGPDVPEHPALRPHDGRGERDGRHALPPQGGRHVDRSSGPPASAGRSGRPARPRASCSTTSASARPSASWPATSPTATSAAWRSPGRWRCSPRCCCWTSPRPA